jgi:hypothetical protein
VPRYAPLPSVSIDPRNEAQIVQQASQRVYEASGQTLNDFSAGNPLAALLEGQAFAQGEFLFWANQLPQSILLEWIGPFLGAMRRLGTPAVARLLVTIPSSSTIFTIPEGTAFTTNPDLTGGEVFSFVTSTETVIPAGESSAFISVASQYVGAIYNAPSNSITGIPAINLDGITVTNPQPASGGSDVETYQEVQERFFTLIRRRNPVSAEDWQDFFTDFYGVGTQTSVQPNRPNRGTYNYLSDYLKPNGQVSFFVLGPNGVELNEEQLLRGQKVINYSVPVENQAHLYPITLSQVQYDIKLEVDTGGVFANDLKDTSLNFRDRLFQILLPGNVFPATTNPTVSDVDAAFYQTFDSNTRFVDPHIEASAAYNTPPLLEAGAATYTNVLNFSSKGSLLTAGDLVQTTLPVSIFYPVLTDFTPYSSDKKDQTVYGNLELQQITRLVPGNYSKGQVCYWDLADGGDGELHIVLENLTIGSQNDVSTDISKGKITGAKTYSPWIVGNSYIATTGSLYSPEIVEYDYVSGDGQFIPDPSSTVPLNKRPGAFAWIVNQNFTLQPSTNDITGAQAANLLGSPVTPKVLVPGQSYSAGDWVQTRQIGSGPNPKVDPYYDYVDTRLGVVTKYAKVINSFVYVPDGQTVSTYFDDLVEQGTIQEIITQNGDKGLPVSRYKPRFPVLTYLEYRSDAMGDPEYYIATKDFTPTSTVAQDMVDQKLIYKLYINPTQSVEFLNGLSSGTVKNTTRMFRFFKGDRTFFRQGSKVISYTATTNVHPLFEFYVYKENGVFVETETYVTGQFESLSYIPFFNPTYIQYSEDTILDEDGRNLYRVMRAFTPQETVVNWTSTTVTNTARIEEYGGNLLRYVDKYSCEQDILSQLGKDISAVKLGVASITLVPKGGRGFSNSREEVKFVWENTDTLNEVPQLSWFSGTGFPYTPPVYGEGTLKL